MTILKKIYNKQNLQLLIFIINLLLISSCGSQKQNQKSQLYNPYEVEELSKTLGIPLNNKNQEDDKNIPLYVISSQMLKTPYKHGGTTTKGTDCSGLVYQIFQKVYQLTMPRSTSQLVDEKYKKVSTKDLSAGDLVFFATGKDKKKATHVGIYLKDNKFIHASTSKGVIINSLDEEYYKKRYIKATRINK